MVVEGKNINLRTVVVDDADFVFSMRQNQKKTKYLSKVYGTVEDQKTWITHYKDREEKQEEFYFILESKNGDKLGLVRIYDFQDNSFCWGSWLIKVDSPKYTAIESALLVYEFAFYTLGFIRSHFDVRKGNDKVMAFHQRFGAKIVDENELDYFFDYTKESYEAIKPKYKRYLK